MVYPLTALWGLRLGENDHGILGTIVSLGDVSVSLGFACYVQRSGGYHASIQGRLKVDCKVDRAERLLVDPQRQRECHRNELGKELGEVKRMA